MHKTLRILSFEYILSKFGCLKIFMSDQGTQFFNKIIEALTEEFQVYHHKSTPYHPQQNRIVEAFNNILENSLTKVCNVNKEDSSGVVGIQNSMQEINKTNTFQAGIWTRSSYAYGIYCAKPENYSYHRYVRL